MFFCTDVSKCVCAYACVCACVCMQNFAAQMSGGFDEKAGGANLGVMQGPMVRNKNKYEHTKYYQLSLYYEMLPIRQTI